MITSAEDVWQEICPLSMHLRLKNVDPRGSVRTITVLEQIAVAFLIFITIEHQKMLTGGRVNGSFIGNWKSRNESSVADKSTKKW